VNKKEKETIAGVGHLGLLSSDSTLSVFVSGCSYGYKVKLYLEQLCCSLQSTVKSFFAMGSLVAEVLQSEDFALCLSPGFFRFYAYLGVLSALQENGCLRVKSCAGSSAGMLLVLICL
jgi:hypothetical protein